MSGHLDATPEHQSPANLSVETEFLNFIDAVDHHIHKREQSVHVFGRGVAHARHYTCTQTKYSMYIKHFG